MNEISEIIDKTFHKEVFKAHIKKYGFDKQITILGEECTELAKEVFKIKRFRENYNSDNLEKIFINDINSLKLMLFINEFSKTYENFVKEYIDVYIMMKQIEPFIDSKLAYNIVHENYKRAYERVKELMV